MTTQNDSDGILLYIARLFLLGALVGTVLMVYMIATQNDAAMTVTGIAGSCAFAAVFLAIICEEDNKP